MAAHAGAENLPRPSGKLRVMVAGSRPSHTASLAPDADVSSAEVDELRRASAVGAGMKLHLGRLRCAQSRQAQRKTNQKTSTPAGMPKVHISHEGMVTLITTTP